MARAFIKSFKGYKLGDRFAGGLASNAFNAMLDIASQTEPRTPVLNTAPSEAIWPGNSGRGLSTGLLNSIIQGSASSFGFLSCILVANQWLNNTYELEGWLCGTIHDEIQFAYPANNAIKAAYLQQIAHAWAWALMHYSAGLTNMPVTTAFASAVNIDKVWRKSAKASVATPTSANIASGKEYSMADLIDIAEQNNYWGIDS